MSGVCDAAQRGRRVNIFSRVFIPLGFLITAVSLIALNTVNAATGSFKVTDAAIIAQSAGVDASIGSFDETRITSDVTFYHLNDSVTYNIELQNTGKNAVTISSISDNNASPYLTYNYSTHAGEEIAAGGTLSLEVEVVYSTAVAEITARSQSLEIEFTINCVEDDEIVVPNTGETSDSESAAVPDTGANAASSGAKVDFAPLIVAIIGTVLLAAGLYRSKLSNKTKIIALALAGSLTIVSAVNASSKDFTFTLASDFEIKSILAVNYNNGTSDVAVVVPYGSTLEDELEEPQIEGYIFNGWLDENDGPFDLTQPVTDDVNIHPDLTPTQYTLYIDIDGDYSYSLEVKLKYDQEYQLPALSRDKWRWGMKHDGWLDRGLDWGAEDDDKRYGAGQVVKGLSSTQDDEIWLETTWSGRTYAVVYQNVDDETFLSAAPTEVSYDEFEANAWKISLPGTPVREGYQFGGWKFNGEGPYTVDYIIALLPEESDDFVVEAIWEKKAMQVCYFSGAALADVTGESKCDTLDYDDTDYTIAHNYFARTGYDPIDSWRYGSVDYTGGQSFDVRAFTNACERPDQNHCSLNLTARWTPRQTVMHFVPGADDATGEVEDAVFTYDQPASGGNSAYTRPGYTHRGWSCDYGSTYGTVTYALSAITTNVWKYDVPEVTCSAVWDENWYWIAFDKNAQDATGGMYGMTVTYGDTTPLNQNQFAREGYKFVGWKWNNEGDLIADGASAGQFPVAANEETVTLYAQWVEPYAVLDTGTNVNDKMKKTIDPRKSFESSSGQTLKSIKTADALPADFDKNDVSRTISTTDSPMKVYAWFKTDTIYIYSDAEKIYGNADMSYMFYKMDYVTTLELPDNLDTSNTTNMSHMFHGMSYLSSLSFPSAFDTSNVEDMSSMFYYMQRLSSLVLPNTFNTSSVTTMYNMFSEMVSLTSLTLPGSFDTSNVTDMIFMFRHMTNLATLNLPEVFNTSNVGSMLQMFDGMSNLTTLTLPEAFDTSNVKNMNGMFMGLNKLTTLNLPSGFNTSQVTQMAYMFSDMPALTTLSLPAAFDTSNVTTMESMFAHSNIPSPQNVLSSLNTSNVTNMERMFLGIENTSLSLPATFDTSNVLSMKSMFWETNLTALTLPSSFDTSKVTNMSMMFKGSGNIQSLVLPEAFSTSSVTSAQEMFSYMTSLTSLTLPNAFIIGSEANTENIFHSIPRTATLYATDATVRSLWPGILGN